MTFPTTRLPLRIRALEEGFIIDDAASCLLGAFYFDEGDEIRRQVRSGSLTRKGRRLPKLRRVR